MDKKIKKPFITAIVSDLIDEIENSLDEQNLEPDDSIFNYELLKAALRRNDQGIVKLLLKIGCSVVNPNKNESPEETPLHLAIKTGQSYTDYDIVSKLMDRGASVYDKNFKGETPLLAAFNKGYLQAVKTMMKKCNCNFDPVNADDVRHFHIACVTNEYYSAEKYLKCGINPNSPLDLCLNHCRRLHLVQHPPFDKKTCDYGGLNPMQFAIEKQYFDLFLRLVKYNGDLSLINAKGLTPLHMIYYSKLKNNEKYWFQHAFKHGNDKKFINSEDEYGVSHFHLCCIIDEPEFVQVFINNGANVNKSVSSTCPLNPGFTPLHFAVNYGCEKVVMLLLRNGADPNKLDECGKAPLHLAYKKSEIPNVINLRRNIIKMLLEYKASPVIPDKKGCTPLHEAFYYEEGEDLKIFDSMMSKIQWGSDNYTDEQGLSFFHIACTTNNINQVVKFLNSGVNIDSSLSSGIYTGFTALHFAVMYNKKEIVRVLLKRNAKVNVRAGGTGVTPLHLACEFNYMKFDQEESEAEVQASCCIVTNCNQISLDLTSSRANQLEIIQLLLSQGSDVNAKDSLFYFHWSKSEKFLGTTPLLYLWMIDRNYLNLCWTCLNYSSSREGDNLIKEIGIRLEKISEILISNKADINARIKNESTILHLISKYKTLNISEKFMQFLVDSGADVNAVNESEGTPLHAAVEYSNKLLVRRLLKHNANPNAVSTYYRVPLYISIKKMIGDNADCREIQKDIFCALLENGSDVNMRTPRCAIYLERAIAYHKLFIIQKLLYYGADINIEDLGGQRCIPNVMEWNKRGKFLDDYYQNVKVFQIIFIHVQKLLALGLPVCEEMQKCCAQLHSHYKSKYENKEDYFNLDNIFNCCTNELDAMKNIKIDCNTSLYDILLKNPHELAKCVSNSNLIKILKVRNDVDRKFPLYGYLLQLQFRRGSVRCEVLQSAEESLTNVLNIDLPDKCYDLIFQHLKNEEIIHLKEVAADVKRNLKRKSCRTRPKLNRSCKKRKPN